jgi:hypothetical protein
MPKDSPRCCSGAGSRSAGHRHHGTQHDLARAESLSVPVILLLVVVFATAVAGACRWL